MNPEENETARAAALARGFLSGQISRRDMLKRSALFGGGALAATTLGPLLAACSASGGASPSGTTSPSATSSLVGTTSSSGSSSSAVSPAPTTSAGGPAPVAGGTLIAALTGNPSSLDPAVAGLYADLQVLDNIFSKLIAMDDQGKFVPELAKSWKQVDPLTYTFDLVDNATFHNGEKFTANDVKYTIARIQNPKTASTYASGFSSIKSVEVVSPTQVTFHLTTSFAPLLTNLALNGEIVNQKAIESGDPVRKPVGTGPFQFVEWTQGDHITIKKYPQYFKSGQPYLDQITFRFLAVDSSRIAALQSGQIDWADAVPLSQLTALKSNSQYTYVTSALGGIPDIIVMNTATAPFNNKALRQAVQAAVDRKEILAVAYSGAGEIGSMEVPSGSQWYGGTDPLASGPNLDLAKQKMKEAGYPNGLTVQYLSLPQYPELQKTAVVVRDQLKQIGIDVQLEQLEVTVWFGRFGKGDFQMTSSYWSGTVDPDNFYSTQLATGSPNNSGKYSNPKVDALIAQGRAETDVAKRKAIYEQIRAIVWADAPLVFAHYETVNYLMRKDVHGSTINPALQLSMEQIWKSS